MATENAYVTGTGPNSLLRCPSWNHNHSPNLNLSFDNSSVIENPNSIFSKKQEPKHQDNRPHRPGTLNHRTPHHQLHCIVATTNVAASIQFRGKIPNLCGGNRVHYKVINKSRKLYENSMLGIYKNAQVRLKAQI
ncbi:hypothetical protein PIB30_076992 [Stylosanthes scabra]|uniref:Uncharacterized protein n=1 Tax=Stylosanthes scabra TaxID=79078 RepID=A0ABU6SRC9_9FABA|nr:hypothetical protein [Stylosanthes scabra]